jgi:hypothetical protein
LPTSFTAPAAPAKPELEVQVVAAAEAELKDVEWPALVDPIDNPELYNRK